MSSKEIQTEQLSHVQLPADVREPFTVYRSGVPQKEGVDFQVEGRTLSFTQPLVREGKLGFWHWFLGAWGIGTYRRNDQVQVTWEVDGKPQLAVCEPAGAPSGLRG